MDLKSKISGSNYRGIVTFSDIHAHADKLRQGIQYALQNNLFIVFLGDLVDGYDKPLETVITVKHLLDEDRAVFVIGNHDDKFHRYAKGNPVTLKKANKKTLEDVPKKHRELFLQTISDIVTHKNADYMHRFGNWTFIHGAAHRDVWSEEEFTKKARHRALYGETTGERDEEDLPVRSYDWVDEIPSEQNVVVGHDRNPYGKGKLDQTGPLHHTGAQGGRAVFTDTGCGKNDNGKLCLTVFDIDGDTIEMVGHEQV